MKNYFLLALLLLVSRLSAQIVNIPDANFKAKLIALGVDTNGDGEIQNTEAESKTRLEVSSAGIYDMTGISAFINLDTLKCNHNYLSALDVSGLVHLYRLECSYNQIPNLVINNLPALYYLECEHSQLNNLTLYNLPSLYYLDCVWNSLQNLNLCGAPSLRVIGCMANQIQSLDVSCLANLDTLYCDGNALMSLYVKNGKNETSLEFSANPNLQFICADASQLYTIQQKIVQYGMTNVNLNSSCPYNILSGIYIYDENTNGCTPLDATPPYLMTYITNGIDSLYVFSDGNGYYKADLDSGTFTLTPKLQNPTYFSASTSSTNVYFPNNNNNLQTQDFCITPNGVFPDVEIVLIPITIARLGFNAKYKVLIHNKGTAAISGNIMLNFMGNKITFVSGSPTISQTANQLIWSCNNLQPFESRVIAFTMNVLPQPTNNMGDILTFVTSIPLVNDVDTVDNYFTFSQNISGPHDPNDKTCLEGNEVSNTEIGEYLHYLIRFQNTGTLYAENVIVMDSIDASTFDIASLQILETSHNAHISIENNSLQFYFENIMLPDSFTNEPESHGYVLFKIKTKANLPQNSSVSNKAEIYFDYNLPVVTNTAITTFGNTIGTLEPLQDNHLKCYPNPAKNLLTIETTKETNCVIVNVLGEELIRQSIWGKQIIDISTLPKGLYWIKTQSSANGHSFVKE